MKINTKKSHKKLVIVIAITILALLASATALAYTQKLWPFEEKDYSTKPASEEEKNTGTSIKKNSIDNADSSKGTSGSDPSPDPTPDPSGGKPGVGVEITAANQNGETLNIRALIQTVTSSGTCSLSMTGPAGKSYNATVDVQALPSSSTCKGFDVPVSSLSTGMWNITVSFENSDVKGATSKEVSIK